MQSPKRHSSPATLSVLILAEKQTDVLSRSIAALAWVDEVLVIDTSPQKKLKKALPSQKNLRVEHIKGVESPLENFAKARNEAQSLAKHDWILWLDSDELLEPAAKDDILEIINSSTAPELVSVVRSDIFHSEKLKYGEGSQRILRLGKKASLVFEGAVHEVVRSQTQVYRSSIQIKHFAHASMSSFVSKITQYSRIAAQHKETSVVENTLELVTFPLAKFLHTFLMKLGFLDGWRGFVYSFCMSLHSLFVRVHRYELLTRNQIKIRQSPLKKYLWLSWIFVFFFSLGQLQRVQITPLVSIYLHDVFVVIWLVLFATDTSNVAREAFYKIYTRIRNASTRLKLLLGWIVFGMLAAFVANFDVVPLLYVLRIVTYSLFILSITALLPKKQLHEMWLVIGVVSAIVGIFQWMVLPDTRFLQVFGWDPHFYRLIGTYFDPAFTGIILALGLFHWQTSNLLKTHHAERMIGSGVIAVALGLTYSRSTYLAMVVGIVLWVGLEILRHSSSNISMSRIQKIATPWILYGLIAVFAVVLAPKPGGEGVNLARTASVSARADNTSLAISSLTPKSMVIGNGLFSIGDDRITDDPILISRSRFPDNLFVMLVTALGILGTLLVVYWGAHFLMNASQRNPENLVIFVMLIVHAQFQNTIVQPFVFIFFAGMMLINEK